MARQGKQTRQAQKADTRQRVRDAALTLFRQKGFAATSTKEIAARAGVASGTVFLHAPDKDDLLCLVMHDLLKERMEAAFAALAADAPLGDQLLAVFGRLFALYDENEKLAAPFIGLSLTGGAGPNAQAVAQLTFEYLGRLAALVASAQARGEIEGDVPILLLAQNLMSAYLFSLVTWISGYAPLQSLLETQLKPSIELQLRGLRPQGGGGTAL